jgi:putative addiction module killer protein
VRRKAKGGTQYALANGCRISNTLPLRGRTVPAIASAIYSPPISTTRSSHLATSESMLNTINTTPEFDTWLDDVKDLQGKAAVLCRLDRAEHGNFGDCEPVGNGLSEMRVFVGPGYRIYFVRTGRIAYLVLWGSDKTDQQRGIKRANEILDALRGN